MYIDILFESLLHSAQIRSDNYVWLCFFFSFFKIELFTSTLYIRTWILSMLRDNIKLVERSFLYYYHHYDLYFDYI